MSEQPWKTLLRKAIEVMESTGPAGIPEPDWSLGGATMLMLDYHHRLSKDIDIFVRDVQYITAFSPRINDRAERIAGIGYDEQSNYLKLRCAEGEIDIIAAPLLTENPTFAWDFGGKRIARETPLEIMAKKAFYRSSELKYRDLFDLTVVSAHEPGVIPTLVKLLGKEKTVSLQQRIRLLLPSYERGVRGDVKVLKEGQPLASHSR